MRGLVAAVVVAAVIAAMPRAADACTCRFATEEEWISGATLAFEGVAVAEETVPPSQPCGIGAPPDEPPAGCIRVRGWDTLTCRPIDFGLIQIDPVGGAELPSVDLGAEGVAERCDLAPGPYRIRIGLVGNRVEEEVVVGDRGVATILAISSANEFRTRFRVEGVIRGEPVDEVWVHHGGSIEMCELGHFRRGARYRVAAGADEEGRLWASGCGGVYGLGEQGLVDAPADDDPPPAKVARRGGCAGCGAGGDSGLPLILVALWLLRRARLDP